MNAAALENIERVLVVVDPTSESHTAIERARTLAAVYDFDMALVAVEYNQYLVEGYYFTEIEIPALRAEYMAERREMLESIAVPLRDEGLTVETHAIWSIRSDQAIADFASSWQADLVIHPVHKHGALSRLTMSYDDWRLAKNCPVPLLMVKHKPWKKEPVLLAAVDPLHARQRPDGLNHEVMTEGKALEAKLGGLLYIGHAYGQFPLSGDYPDKAEVLHRGAINELADEFEVPGCRRLLSDQVPEFALHQFADELQADVMLVGGVRRNVLEDIVVGSTAEKVLEFLDCDVLLLKSKNSSDTQGE